MSDGVVVFVLEDTYGMRIHGQGQFSVEGIAKSLEEIFGSTTQTLMIKMQQYLAQSALTWSDLTVKRAA